MSSLHTLSSALRHAWTHPVHDHSTHVRFDSRAGALWTLVIALDFFWLSNPLVLWSFDSSLRNACAVTLGAVLLTPMRRTLRPPVSVVAVLAYGCLTVLWSNYAIFTTHFVLIYMAIAVVAMGVAVTVDARAMAQGMLLGGVLHVLASVYAFRAGLPGSAAAPGEGILAGVGMNRNILSYTVILALPFAVSVAPRTWWGRSVWAAGLGVLGLGLYLAQSATGFVAAVVVVGAAVVMGLRDRSVHRLDGSQRHVGWLLRLLPAATVITAIVVLLASIRATGRDGLTLTGRTPVWSATWDTVQGWDRWFGAGWGVVWPHPWYPTSANEIHTEIVERAGVFLVHGHNSFFDLLPELGLIGSAIFASIYLQAVARAVNLRRLSAAPTTEGMEASRTILLGVLALVVYGITEPMSTVPLGWFVVVMLTADVTTRSARAAGADGTPHVSSSETSGVDPRSLTGPLTDAAP